MRMSPNDPRFYIFNLINNYQPFDASEENSKKLLLELVSNYENCFDRTLTAGHVNGGALVVDESFEYTLLTHHKKYDKWFQFGGHSDGDPNTFAVALREATEESGLKSLRFLSNHHGIFDIDVHPIPASNDMPEHNHHEVRILLIANKNEKYIVSSESKDLKWIKLEDAAEYNTQPAFLRLIEKAKTITSLKSNNL